MSTATTRRRLSRGARREQLLGAAMDLIREGGAGDLTLSKVATAAGVTKALAYDHFATTSELFGALYERIDEQQLAAIAQSLATANPGVERAARVIADAYVDCVLLTGAEFGEITAAVMARADLAELLHQGRRRYARLMLDVLERQSGHTIPHGPAIAVALVNAGDALAVEVRSGRIPDTDARSTLTHLIVALTEPQGSA